MHATGKQTGKVALSREIAYDYGKNAAGRKDYAKHKQMD
jgi:hypothetical protein